MPVEIVRRDAGTKFDSRKLKKTANEILQLRGEGRAELSIALIGNGEMRIEGVEGVSEGVRLTFLLVSCFRKRSKRFAWPDI